MDATQLALFPDTAVTGSGQPAPWPAAAPDVESETPAADPDQLAFGDTEAEAA
ncbi:hypothetical protein ABZZ74_23670 [Streptomyces sp. NPDC006476]|uniref:hypothetical protein n=1 Tax=Streptomyces sp. NPDC006476 TaxID=3157175 RepID=UPI0033B181DF